MSGVKPVTSQVSSSIGLDTKHSAPAVSVPVVTSPLLSAVQQPESPPPRPRPQDSSAASPVSPPPRPRPQDSSAASPVSAPQPSSPSLVVFGSASSSSSNAAPSTTFRQHGRRDSLDVQASRRSNRTRNPPSHLSDYDLSTRARSSGSASSSSTAAQSSSSSSSSESAHLAQDQPRLDFVALVSEAKKIASEPQDFRSASTGPDSPRWMKAMQDEMKALLDNQTWEVVALPTGKHAISAKWVYKDKPTAEGMKAKARLVARGFLQRPGLDFLEEELYAPVAKIKTIRCILILAVHFGLQLHHLDVSTAFLNGILEDEVYMRQPEGFVDPKRPHAVLRLLRALYGLKQSPRLWFKTIFQFLSEYQYVSNGADTCLFYKVTSRGIVIVCLFVDDILIAFSDEVEKDILVANLKRRFKMHDLGKPSTYLGLEISHYQSSQTSSIQISQAAYILKLLDRFDMSNSQPTSTPLTEATLNDLVRKTENKEIVVDSSLPCREAIGALLYLATCTRPDILVSVSKLSHFHTSPSAPLFSAIKSILRYLNGTRSLSLTYVQSPNAAVELTSVCDASWADNSTDRKSTCGFVHFLCGSPIAWSVRKQPSVALSTAEAEYVSLSLCTQDLLWFRQLISGLNITLPPSLIHVDNQACIENLRNSGQHHTRMKHIDIRFHFVREKLLNNTINIAYVASDANTADLMTKPLKRFLFNRHRDTLLSPLRDSRC